jgi:C1A family cysteine protease
MSIVRVYGWKPDLPKPIPRFARLVRGVDLPDVVNLGGAGGLMQPCYDQGNAGSCTANGGGGAVEYLQRKQKLANIFTPSRLGIYYQERALEGTVDSDSGAMISDTVKVLSQWGAPPETLWPYNLDELTIAPPASVMAAAAHTKLLAYQPIDQSEGVDAVREVVALGGVVILGFSVYDSFESDAVAKTGIVPMPDVGAETLLGGHCVLIVGYDNTQRRFFVRNSWGTGWGINGYCVVPYDYFMNPELANSLYALTSVEES